MNSLSSNLLFLQAYVQKYVVKNYFYYYLFRFSAALGQEVFYITFLPFTHWNIDPYLSRRLILIWVVSITITHGSLLLLHQVLALVFKCFAHMLFFFFNHLELNFCLVCFGKLPERIKTLCTQLVLSADQTKLWTPCTLVPASLGVHKPGEGTGDVKRRHSLSENPSSAS